MRSGQVRRASLWVGATVVMGGLGVLNAPGTAADQNVADPPTIGGATASEVTDTTATLTAEVNPGGAPTSLSVSCTGGAYKWTATGTGPGRTPAPATAKMTGLTPSTAYTCALSATNSAGSATSSPANFTTSPAPSSGPTPTPNPTPTPTPTSTPAPTVTAPSVGATSASAVGSDRATVSAPVTPNGAATSATATCTGGAWTAGGAVAGSGASETTVAVPLTGLSGGTLYTCAIRATNTAGSTTSAAPVTFTTASATQATAKLAVSAKTVKARKGKGATYTVATFTDPADLPASSYTVTIAWGDGKTSKGTVTRTGKGTYKVTGKHTYRTGGVKAPKVRVGKAGAPAVSAQARPPAG